MANPVNELVKLPIPIPSAVLLSAVVGDVVVLQHIPLVVMALPPSAVMFPPEVAETEVIAVMAVVVRVGKVATVVNDTSFP